VNHGVISDLHSQHTFLGITIRGFYMENGNLEEIIADGSP